jgi:RES domain-containing protein
MRVYRVCSAAYRDLDGEGARLYGGRWNSPGLSIVYTASTLALAILETRVHLRRMPVDYVRLTIEIPDIFFHPNEVDVRGLDPEWRLDRALTRRIGDEHFSNTPLVPLKVPSVVVDTEWNILFSRDYASANVSIVGEEPVTLDPRLWSV